MKDFNEIWNERLSEYETIPDKNKISNDDKEFARGYHFAIQNMQNIIDNYLVFDEERKDILEEIQRQIIKKYNEYAVNYMADDFEMLLTSIFDSYVE